MKIDHEKCASIYYTEDAIDGDLARKLRNLIQRVYSEIRSKAYYVSNPTDEICIYTDDTSDPYISDQLPSVLIVGNLVNRSTTLLDGSPGSGKTRTVKIVSRLMTGSSMEESDNIIYGDEELNKEKWMAIPNVKEMMPGGGEKDIGGDDFPLIWAPFFRDGYKGIVFFVDEVNRANPRSQSEFLSFMADGIVQYSVASTKKIAEFRIFLTRNPMDMKTGSIVYPLNNAFKDRITQSVLVPLPSTYGMDRVEKMRKDDRNYEINLDDTIKPIMTVEDVRIATILASKIPVTKNGSRYARYLVRDACLCQNAPLYDKTLAEKSIAGSNICDGCHFNGSEYNCKKYAGGSMRIKSDLIAVAKAYCFWLKIPEVTEHVIRSIALNVISHRILVVPSELESDDQCVNSREFLKKYLVDWSFKNLQKRKNVEDIYDRLFNGTSTNPSKDQQEMIMNAKNDLYVLADLLPKVMKIPMDGNKLPTKIEIHLSTNDADYRDMAKRIRETMNGDEPPEKKKKKLGMIYKEIIKGNIPFSKNLRDMIFDNRHRLDEMIEENRFNMEKKRSR